MKGVNKMFPSTVKLSSWTLIAFNAFTRYQNNTLPTSGDINCPRSIILNFFNETDFEFLCQEKNITHYKIRG
jgi:hypothetical protein